MRIGISLLLLIVVLIIGICFNNYLGFNNNLFSILLCICIVIYATNFILAYFQSEEEFEIRKHDVEKYWEAVGKDVTVLKGAMKKAGFNGS